MVPMRSAERIAHVCKWMYFALQLVPPLLFAEEERRDFYFWYAILDAQTLVVELSCIDP